MEAVHCLLNRTLSAENKQCFIWNNGSIFHFSNRHCVFFNDFYLPSFNSKNAAKFEKYIARPAADFSVLASFFTFYHFLSIKPFEKRPSAPEGVDVPKNRLNSEPLLTLHTFDMLKNI